MVGVRIALVEGMEENYRIIPEFWKSILNSNLFSEVCSLSNQSPKGVLGVSVYENPQRIFYYIAVSTNEPAPSGMFNLKSRLLHGLFLKTKVILKRMCRTFSEDFIQNGFHFQAMNTQEFQM